MRGKTLNQYMAEQLKDDEFREEWERSQPELDVIRAIVDARIKICAKVESKIDNKITKGKICHQLL